jgi:hypothetical protein
MSSSDVVQNVHVVTSPQTLAAGSTRVMVHMFYWKPALADQILIVKDGSGSVLFDPQAREGAPYGEN